MNRTKMAIHQNDLSMNKVRDPFELRTIKNLELHTCDDVDGFDVDHPDFLAGACS